MSECKGGSPHYDACCCREKLESENRRLRDIVCRIVLYGSEHTTRCAFVNRPGGHCTCGLEALGRDAHEALHPTDTEKGASK